MLGETFDLQNSASLAVGFAVTRRHGSDRRLTHHFRSGGPLLVFGSDAGDGSLSGRFPLFTGTGHEREKILDTADQAAAQEADQQHKDPAEHQLPGGAD